MSDQRKAEEIAAERIKMRSSLLEENQDQAALAEKKPFADIFCSTAKRGSQGLSPSKQEDQD